MKPICNYGYCNYRDTKYCSRCKTVSYCSKDHQKKDWIIHKLICYPDLSDRLKGMCEFFIKYEMNNSVMMNLTSYNYFVLNKIGYRIDIFGKKDIYEYICIMCKNKINYNGPYLDLTIYFYYNNACIEYYRCTKCHSENKVLCNKHFIDKTLCHINNNKISSLKKAI